MTELLLGALFPEKLRFFLSSRKLLRPVILLEALIGDRAVAFVVRYAVPFGFVPREDVYCI